jgi:hypothetical protein
MLITSSLRLRGICDCIERDFGGFAGMKLVLLPEDLPTVALRFDAMVVAK